jgi:IS1 family transposase
MRDRSRIMFIMNKLTVEERAAVVRALVEGCSIRATARMTGVARNTVTKLLVDLGTACSEFQDRTLRNLPCKRLQLDEIWSFVYSKAKNVPADRIGEFGVGDVWTWTAIDAESKLIPSWLIGTRDGDAAKAFVNDLASRLANRVQITSDGHSAYLQAVEDAFGWDVDYAMLVKIYGAGGGQSETRYSPAVCVGCNKHRVTGNPDPAHVSTSYAERANLSMRMHMRRFTRLTNAFSKKLENHVHAIALYFMWYNFGRIHQTLRCTPAMRAGVSDHVWSIEEIVGLLDFAETHSN